MGLTHAEFFRDLPAALEYRDYTVVGDHVQIPLGDRVVAIELGAQRARTIASLTLPYTEVSFEFDGFTDAELEQFMHRFDLTFQRGGG